MSDDTPQQDERPAKPPVVDYHLVGLLEAMLADARAGKIRNLAAVYSGTDPRIPRIVARHRGKDGAALLGHARMLARLIEDKQLELWQRGPDGAGR